GTALAAAYLAVLHQPVGGQSRQVLADAADGDPYRGGQLVGRRLAPLLQRQQDLATAARQRGQARVHVAEHGNHATEAPGAGRRTRATGSAPRWPRRTTARAADAQRSSRPGRGATPWARANR